MSAAGRDVVIAFCRDEQDLVGAFVDFYLDQGFDQVCLIDNGSRDRTVDHVLRHPRRERVSLLVDPQPGYDKRLLETYERFTSDGDRWTFFLDIDEFVDIPGGIKSYAAKLPQDVTVLRLPVVEMLPDPLLPPWSHPLETARREASFQRDHKLVWRRCDVRRILCGKHAVELEPYREHSDDSLFVRHYHTRSQVQFRQKLHNRIETDAALSADDRRELSAFPEEVRRRWIAESEELLEPDGWARELARVNAVPVVRDDVVKRWYDRRASVPPQLEASPVVTLSLSGRTWHCYTVAASLPEEGHTAAEHMVMVHGGWPESWSNPVFEGVDGVPVRIHSECLFGDVFGGDRCDCGGQLAYSLDAIHAAGHGVIVYLRQEGRGVGLFNKVRALALTEPTDTFARNRELGLPADGRGYRLAGHLLQALGVRSARLLSGNPAKLSTLREMGIEATPMPCTTLPSALSSEAREEFMAKLANGYLYEANGGSAPA